MFSKKALIIAKTRPSPTEGSCSSSEYTAPTPPPETVKEEIITATRTSKRLAHQVVAIPQRTIRKKKLSKMYPCHLCDHVSSRRYNLNTHVKTHDKERVKEFGCPECPKRFDRRHDRDRHLGTVHGEGVRAYSCEYCSNHYSRRDALNRHLVKTHGYKDSDFDEHN